MPNEPNNDSSTSTNNLDTTINSSSISNNISIEDRN